MLSKSNLPLGLLNATDIVPGTFAKSKYFAVIDQDMPACSTWQKKGEYVIFLLDANRYKVSTSESLSF